ncbi:MAG: non-hydrolyzing UDP-N-acetylglucosamine 2-epimerase [Sphingomonadales bacterium]
MSQIDGTTVIPKGSAPVSVIHLIAAARPNFMKVAPLYHQLKGAPWCDVKLVHTGQHYDVQMSDAFFRDLGLPPPDFNLGVGSASHARQTAGVMVAYEEVCEAQRPDWIVVVGDVNSTVACALVGAKLWIPIAHLEAGLRSGDRTMPEEINRLVTDAIADLLLTPSSDADENLKREGIPAHRIDCVGNIMIDSFELLRPRIARKKACRNFGLKPGNYGVVTLHRPSNVDCPDVLAELIEQLVLVAQKLPLIFPVHPRTRDRIEEFGFEPMLARAPLLKTLEPLNYAQFMALVQECSLVITDSGGIQEETTYLDIPCLTLRDTTERPITIRQGTNRLVPTAALLTNVNRVLNGEWRHGKRPDLWDGQTAARVAESLKRRIKR